jgi:DNA-binding CsgD family transcriptional regulator
VRGHVQHILEKLDAHSKLEAVARAAKFALLSG